MQGLVALVAAIAIAAALGVWLPRRGHRLARPTRHEQKLPTLLPSDLGQELGERATLVQFSTAFCQPCRATRRVLDEVSATIAGIAHIEVDAESNLELVRRLDIRRTPTVLVLDARGRIIRRASGQPRKADVIAAVGAAVAVRAAVEA